MIHHPPIMVDPMGQHWTQPARHEVLIDDNHAVMSKRSLSTLMNYSASVTSGVYDGKMWKTLHNGAWYLRWFSPSENTGHCKINARLILVLEDQEVKP